VAVTIHTDTLNESCCVERSVAAFKVKPDPDLDPDLDPD